MSDCIDLRERFGDTHRIGYEEQKAQTPREEWPWLARIRCRYGYVGVQGGDRLHALTSRARIGARLRTLPFVEKAQGAAEVRVVFHVDHLETVLGILQPYKRRQLSAEQRAAAAERGAEALAAHRRAKAQDEITGPGSTQSDPDRRG